MTSLELTRDCDAVAIPAGTPASLPKGTQLHITQTLGGTYTVHVNGALFRIEGHDADALGFEPAPTPAPVPAPTGDLDEKQIWEVLKSCFDPEIPVNIVDLGLVYDMNMATLPNGRSKVDVKMTLTAPGCGMGGVIAGDAQQKLLQLDDIEEATVEIVWDPPWHQSMITVEGRKVLGL